MLLRLQRLVPPCHPLILRTNELNATTGPHMNGDIQPVDLLSYLLAVSGLVDHPLSLTFTDLRFMPRVTAVTPIVCSTFSDSATFAGIPQAYVLQQAGIQDKTHRAGRRGWLHRPGFSGSCP